MAIVPNWAEPLKESVLKPLPRVGLTYGQFEEIRKNAALLDGSPVSEELAQRLAQQLERFEQRYQSALKELESDSISTVENGIRELFPLEGYKDCPQKIAEARERVARMQKAQEELDRRKRRRNTLIGLAAALAAALVIAILVIQSNAADKAVRAKIADIQVMADAGQNDEALAAITALISDGKMGDQFPEMYDVTETVLENTASGEGFSAAFALYDSIRASMPDAIQTHVFDAYAESKLEGNALSPAEKWDVLCMLDERDVAVSSSEAIAENYLASLPAEDAGEAAILAVDRDFLSRKNDAVTAATEGALTALPADEGWDLAQRAAELRIIDAKGTEMADAFDRYVSTLDVAEAWPIVYSANTEETIAVSSEFFAGMYARYVQSMTADAAWADLQTYVSDGTLSDLPQDTVSQVADAYLDTIAEKLDSGAQMDVAAWVKAQRALLDAAKPGPDAALRLVYAMNDAGGDVAALFPDGIAIRLPIASRVCALTDQLVNNSMPDELVNLSTLLPISITEEMRVISHEVDTVANLDSYLLSQSIEALQNMDSHYTVRLLPEYLFRLPESARPASFAECTALLCMQSVYLRIGEIVHTRETTYGSRTIDSSKTLYPYFSALNLVMVYDMADSDLCNCYWMQVNPATVEDDEWFETHKNSEYLFTEEYLLGNSDMVATKEAFEELIDEIPLMRMLAALID